MNRTVLLGLNEINFDVVKRYVDQGKLPGFAELIKKHGLQETTSEAAYEQLEPWIQWVSVQTGMTFAEHQVFRLGDIVDYSWKQIFEELEKQNLVVGAVAPMNAVNRLSRSPYFVPDPWTRTEMSGSRFLRFIWPAVAEAVNDNAHRRLSFPSAIKLAMGLAWYASPRNYVKYVSLVLQSLKKRWALAMLFDLFCFDLHERLFAFHRPDFSMVFLNAGAHIQHHYFFNSSAIESVNKKNPSWYVDQAADPVLEIYSLYDRLVQGFLRRHRRSRVIVATGLSQVPYEDVTFYYRLKKHVEFLQLAGIEGIESVAPRMSRDFLISFRNEAAAQEAERVLVSAFVSDGMRCFEEVDNRGDSLFVTLTYPNEIEDGTYVEVNGRRIDLKKRVSLVAVKNGHHSSKGFVIDTAIEATQIKGAVPVTSLYDRVRSAFNLIPMQPIDEVPRN